MSFTAEPNVFGGWYLNNSDAAKLSISEADKVKIKICIAVERLNIHAVHSMLNSYATL